VIRLTELLLTPRPSQRTQKLPLALTLTPAPLPEGEGTKAPARAGTNYALC